MFCAMVMLLFVVNCATTHYGKGRKALEKKQYSIAIKELLEANKQHPDNPEILRDLGIALYRKIEFQKSIKILRRAYELNPNDGLTIFYLGTAYEILGVENKAIELYRQYTNINRFSPVRASVEQRLLRLINRQIEKDVQKALVQENSLDPSAIPDNAVAVLYFKNMGNNTELDPLQKGLTDMLITDLSKANQLQVIERARLQKLLEEMGLGTTGLVDETTAPRVGKLLGAAKIINGVFLDLNSEKLQVNANITNIKSGEFNNTGSLLHNLDNFFYMEKALVYKILREMDIRLTQEEKDAIRKVPTENLMAFMTYCKGMDYEDREMYQEANDAFQKAVQLDPSFKLAQKKIEHTQSFLQDEIRISQLVEQMDAAQEAAVTPQQQASPVVLQRLEATQAAINTGFTPGVDSRTPLQEQSQQTFGNSTTIEVKVPLPE